LEQSAQKWTGDNTHWQAIDTAQQDYDSFRQHLKTWLFSNY